jgi:hypothetical protein
VHEGVHGSGATYSLQLILPKLLLLGLVQEREVADMVHEYEAKNGEFGVFWSDLALVRAERRPKALEGCGRRELGDFEACLLREELALEI